jgi:hypothetical protein
VQDEEANMRRMIGIAVAVVLVLAVLRRFGSALRDRAMAKCQEMFDRMPEDFPPKRSFHELEEIGEENTSILRRLERQDVRPLLARSLRHGFARRRLRVVMEAR